MSEAHPEDVKAELRKRFGSVFKFEDRFGLPRKSVSDFLRGRPNQRVGETIKSVLANDAGGSPADLSDCSEVAEPSHRLIAGAR